MTEPEGQRDEAAPDVDVATVREVTEEAIAWARERDFAGWDPYDGLNSPLLSAVGRTPLLRLVGTHFVNRCPFNTRRLLGVPKERNPMGIALFARSLLHLHELDGSTRYLARAESLLQWLLEQRASAHAGSAWGYNFDWQNGWKFYLPAYEPCLVVSVLCGRAFLHHWRVTGSESSLRAARGVWNFMRTDMNTVAVDDHTVYTYTCDDEFVAVNANALAAGYLAHLDEAVSASGSRDRADDLVAFVVDRQTADGAWYYADPPEDSHLAHDNFHTGYVVESLRDYLLTADGPRSVERAYERGLRFYRTHLFERDGAPRFEHDSARPRDVHGAAQGIRTFVRDGDPAVVADAGDIVRWVLDNLLDPSGYFYRTPPRFTGDATPYIRWSQAWMCFALSSLCYYAASDGSEPAVAP